MTSPLERARLLDAEMQLQRAWLELNLRQMQAPAHSSPWEKLQSLNRTFNFGNLGLSLLKHRSLWVAAASMLVNIYRRRSKR
ncbi:MAG TPA: hypothetical protein VM146_17920 [Steroidobacteraceae bacterium]|nr:hypothetical protein [Steroidobacteraceae bacterium]